ncbi:sulfatase-like hydrolase/transferase [Rhodospirillum sp. A1_3_36]|uniref:sulfatase-like hydrolase/transferase n=1 Tax=Rhodospirillum sp. A1_3_36 TaxID=3391666 RepID=UPI0039A4A559
MPIEIPVIALVLVLLPRRVGGIVAAVVTVALGTLLFLKIADIGVQSAFQRRFNPYLDVKMLSDGWNLLSGSIGTFSAALVVAAAIGGFFLLLWLCFWLQRQLAAATGPAARAAAVAFGGLLIVGSALWLFGPTLGLGRIADASALPYLGHRLTLVQESIADMRRFEKDLAAQPNLPPADSLFRAVRGRDVVLIFVESYGRSAIEDPRYAPLIRPRLRQIEEQLDAAGYASASGWSWSPTMGGLSWLAHSTFLSGLWIDSQARYDRLMISDQPSLNSLFRRAGWRTAAVMPAITMDWPEAAYFGYDETFVAKTLGYKGKPFNWVTMPDQYTLLAFDRLVRHPSKASDKPVMAEIALISSHAPWTPVPKLIDWADVGDGTAFNAQAVSGDPPRVVWADDERVRTQYIETIDYSLQTLGDYIAHFGENGVFIILGDHQPAPLVTGPDASRSVPVHIVSRDRALIDRFQKEGFSLGMTPRKDAPEPRMDTMRDRLIRGFAVQGPVPVHGF